MDQFENQISQPPNAEGTSFIQKFQSDPANINVCKEYLANQNCSKELQFNLSSIILNFVKRSYSESEQSLMQLDNIFKISDWCIDILRFNNRFFDKPTIKVISTIFGFIIYNLWNNDMDTKFNNISNAKLSSFISSELMENQNELPPFCQLNLMNETILIFSEHYNDFQSKENDQRKIFGKKLDILYEIAKYFISQTKDQDIIEIGLQVIFNCITYGEISNFNFTTDDSEYLFTPQKKIENILSPDEIDFLFNIYLQTNKYYAMRSLYAILKITNSTFTNQPYLLKCIIESYTVNFRQIFLTFLKIDNPNLLLLTELVLSYSRKLTDKFVIEDDQLSPSFLASTEILFQFFSTILDSSVILRETMSIYSNLMNFWATLANVFMRKLDKSKPIVDQINQIAVKYTSFLLKLILTNDLELIEQIINGDSLTSPYQLLMSSSAVDTFSLVLNVFAQYLSENKSQLALALFLKLSSVVLEITQVNILQDSIIPRKIEVFNLSLKIIQSTTHLLQQNPNSISIILEFVVLQFIQNIKKYSMDSLIQDFYKSAVFLMKRAILSLRLFGENDQIIEKACEALDGVLKIDFPQNDDYIEYKNACSELLHNFSEFPFFKEKSISDDTQKENKMAFISSVYSISMKFGCLFVVNNFLNSLLESNDIVNLVICLNGILPSLEDKINASKIPGYVVDWLIPKNILFFVQHCKNPNECLLIFEFWEKLLQYNTIRIPKHSDCGIVIFEAISDTLSSAITFYINNLNKEECGQLCFQLLESILSCSALLLEKKYIMYNAFKIYNNPMVVNFMNILFDFNNHINFQDIIINPKLLISLCSLFNVIALNHLDFCSQQIFIQIAIFYSNMMLQNHISVFKNKSLNIFEGLLSFLQYINVSARNDINEIRASLQKHFLEYFCVLTEHLINCIDFDHCNIIKELIIYNPKMLEIFKNNFVLLMQDSNPFVQFFDQFIKELPKLLDRKALLTDFGKYWERFIQFKDEMRPLYFKEIH